MKPILLIGWLFLKSDSKDFLNWGSKLAAMKNTILLLGVFLVSLSLNAIGQENTLSEPVVQQENDIKTKWDNAIGSFQFEILKERSGDRNFQIDMTVINEIEANRHLSEVVYISYNDFMRIKILPTNQISGDFVHLDLLKEVDAFTNL